MTLICLDRKRMIFTQDENAEIAIFHFLLPSKNRELQSLLVATSDYENEDNTGGRGKGQKGLRS